MDQVLSMPGFRFHPTDEELISHFLKKKVRGRLRRVEAITEIDLYKYEPWDLPGKSCLRSRDLQWYFFSRRSKKYPNGHKKERSTKAGYWKITGKDKAIYSKTTGEDKAICSKTTGKDKAICSKTTGKDKAICSVSQQSGVGRQIGMKKTLVYHTGRAPRGNRTNWVMHEYRLEDKLLDLPAAIQDSYVICRIFQKSGAGPKTAEEYGAPFREEDWNEEISAEAGATFSLGKGYIACDPKNSTLSHANNNVSACPGVAQELDNGVIILDKNYAPEDPKIKFVKNFLSACLNHADDPELNLNGDENLQQGANKDQTKSDDIFEGLEDIYCLSRRHKAIESTMQDNNSSFHLKGDMDAGVQGSASFDQFLPDTHESSRDSLQGCFFELNDLANPVLLNSFLQETHGNWDASNGSDDFGVSSMAWYQSESVNKSTGPNFSSSDQYISTEVAKRTLTSQYGKCTLLEGDNSEIELRTRPQAEYSGTPFWIEGQSTNATSSTGAMTK